MFSMAVAGLAKSLIAVTVSLHPAAAPHAPGYTVQPGDTLSAIAARAYGSAADWPAIWWANRRQVPDPDLIITGQRLALPSSPRCRPGWPAPPWPPPRRHGRPRRRPPAQTRQTRPRPRRPPARRRRLGRGELVRDRGLRVRR